MPTINTLQHGNLLPYQHEVLYDGIYSDPFPINRDVKQGCVLVPTLFEIFFCPVPLCAFHSPTDDVYLHTGSVGKLLSLTRLHANTKMSTVLIKELLFADDAALVSNTEDALQRLWDGFIDAYKQFGIIGSLKKTNRSTEDTMPHHHSHSDKVKLEVVDKFTFSKSTVSNNLLFHGELDGGSKCTFMASMSKRV